MGKVYRGFSVMADGIDDDGVIRCVGHTPGMVMVNWLAFYCAIVCRPTTPSADIEALFEANGKAVNARVVPIRLEVELA